MTSELIRCNNVAYHAINSGSILEAAASLENALSIMSSVETMARPLGTNKRLCIDSVSNISPSLYIYQRDAYDEGMQTHGTPLPLTSLSQHQSSSALNYHRLISTTFYNWGQIQLRLNDDGSALNAFQRALKSAQICYENDGGQLDLPDGAGAGIVGILHNIGYIHYRAGRCEDALATYSEALVLTRSVFGTYHFDIASTLNCIGVLHFHMAKPDVDKSLEMHTESLNIRRAMSGSEDQVVATTLNNIGRVHYMKGQYGSAMSMYCEALRIRRSILGPDHLDVAATVYNAGQTHHQIGQLDHAMRLYKEFLRIARARLGENHRDVSIILKCVAQIYPSTT